MDPDELLDYAQFELSPRRSRCELIVSGNGKTERIASGSVKPFVAHLKAAEEQASSGPVIRLQVERRPPGGAAAWFNKGTLDRFVRFVSTPEIIELPNTLEVEMSQLEGARNLYSQGAGDPLGAAGESEKSTSAAADITKKELLRAIDVRLAALKQDLATACSRASSAGFTLETVSELILFADQFGALRLSEACTKYMKICQRRPDLVNQHLPTVLPVGWKGFNEANLRGSAGSDMSIDESEEELGVPNKQVEDKNGGFQIQKPGKAQNPVEGTKTSLLQQQANIMHNAPDKKNNMVSDSTSTEPTANPDKHAEGGGVKRLSVQDRISLFENKQKEQVSTPNSSTSATARNATAKGEHKRVPSSSSMEKLVLKRWSGASDMSIDLSNDSSNSNDFKESGSSVQTPTSHSIQSSTSANLHCDSKTKSELEDMGLNCSMANNGSAIKDNVTDMGSPLATLSTGSASTDVSSFYSAPSSFAAATNTPPTVSHENYSRGKNSSAGTSETLEVSRIPAAKARIQTLANKGEGTSMKDGAALSVPFSDEQIRMRNQQASTGGSDGILFGKKHINQKEQGHSELQEKHNSAKSGAKDQQNPAFERKSNYSGPKTAALTDSDSKSLLGKVERNELLTATSQKKNMPKKAEGAGRRAPITSEMDRQGHPVEVKGDARHHSPLDITLAKDLNTEPVLSDNKASDFRLVSDHPKDNSVEQSRAMRPAKGNQLTNNELELKAKELEKLFAEHKLRTQNDQLASSRTAKPPVLLGNAPDANEAKTTEVIPDYLSLSQRVKKNASELDADSSSSEKHLYTDGIEENHGTVSLSDESRGKFYELYMQKREVKLREEWKLRKEKKESLLKAMYDDLDRCQTDMRTKFTISERSRSHRHSASAYISGSRKTAHSYHQTSRDKEQDVVSLQEEEPGSEYISGDVSYRSFDSGKRSSGKVLSSAPRTSVSPVPKPFVKNVNPVINRRNIPENPLAQSVPNFSDLRKENTKPPRGASRGTARAEKNFSRSKSISEETSSIIKEDTSRRSQSMRKSFVPGEIKDISTLTDDLYKLPSSRMSRNQNEGAFGNSIGKKIVQRLPRKDDGVRPMTNEVKHESFRAACSFQNGEECVGFEHQEEYSHDEGKEGEEEYESIEENARETDFPPETDSEYARISNGNSDDPCSENGDICQPRELAGGASSNYTTFDGNMQNLLGEVPLSWNSRQPHLFSYARENSDADDFVDSPIGSPAPWNALPLDHMGTEVARMRKKWGNTQVAILGATSQHPRKDVTKGLKKFLNFGRKSRGVDSPANDWVSASTPSEGDDEMEDGHDLVQGPTDDMKKTRAVFSVPSHIGFENDVFTEAQSLCSSIPNAPVNFRPREDQNSLKVPPRSFFSLSSFRSKGTESKPR